MVEIKDKDVAESNASMNQSTANSVAVGVNGAPIERRNVENKTRQITDYQLLRVIGTGTFGKVYLALLDGQPVAEEPVRFADRIMDLF